MADLSYGPGIARHRTVLADGSKFNFLERTQAERFRDANPGSEYVGLAMLSWAELPPCAKDTFFAEAHCA